MPHSVRLTRPAFAKKKNLHLQLRAAQLWLACARTRSNCTANSAGRLIAIPNAFQARTSELQVSRAAVHCEAQSLLIIDKLDRAGTAPPA